MKQTGVQTCTEFNPGPVLLSRERWRGQRGNERGGGISTEETETGRNRRRNE
jgi:hypothetical protein